MTPPAAGPLAVPPGLVVHPDAHPAAAWRNDDNGSAGWEVTVTRQTFPPSDTRHGVLGDACSSGMQLACLAGVRSVRVHPAGDPTAVVFSYDRADNIWRTERQDVREDEANRTALDMWAYEAVRRTLPEDPGILRAILGSISVGGLVAHLASDDPLRGRAIRRLADSGLITRPPAGRRWELTDAGRELLGGATAAGGL